MTNNFDSNTLISEGYYTGSYYGVLRSGHEAAFKRMDFDTQFDKHFLKQVFKVSRLKHKNIINLLGYCLDDGLRVLAYEYASKGSLQDILHVRKGGIDGAEQGPVLSWFQRVKIAHGIASGLQYLHEIKDSRSVKFDIQSGKVVVFDDYVAKIEIRFDMLDHERLDTIIDDSVPYAPEMRGPKGDIYFFGVVLLELLTGRKPIDITLPISEQKLVKWAKPKLLSQERVEEYVDPKLKGEYPPKSFAKIAIVTDCCLQYNVYERPDINMIVQTLESVLNTR